MAIILSTGMCVTCLYMYMYMYMYMLYMYMLYHFWLPAVQLYS